MPDTTRLALEDAVGLSFFDKADQLFRSRGLAKLDRDSFNHRINSQLLSLGFSPFSFTLAQKSGIEILFDRVLQKTCTDIALEPHRQELTSWTSKAKKGTALFVNAIMGLGKTFSIVNALGSDRNKSAIIFMPTRRLCYEMTQRLKQAFSDEHIHEEDDLFDRLKEEVPRDDDYADYHYANIPPGWTPYRFKRQALGNHVYFLDGINDKECPHYTELIKRYQKRWYRRKGICDECVERKTCRFLKHWEKAVSSRIIVTTHQQYDRVYNDPSLCKWEKVLCLDENHQPITRMVERDYFVIDEDLVLSQCYQPISLKPDELRAFIATIIDVIQKVLPEESTGLQEKITLFWGRISLCDTTAIIRPIDPNFQFPEEVVEEWEKAFHYQHDILPDTLDWGSMVGNHILDFENAMRKGVVVQKYQIRTEAKEKEWYLFHLPNPKKYDLSNLPPHVFFDGTMLSDKFLKHKLLNVELEPLPIPVKPLWNMRVWQNSNSDLPRTKLSSLPLQLQVLNFISYVFSRGKPDSKYLFIGSKGLRKRFLEVYLTSNYPAVDYKIVHYGQVKGLNVANDCNVVVMLGSYLISDAVEIAMALDFIQDAMPTVDVIKTEVNVWSWKRDGGRRVYNERFKAVQELAEQYRFSEQRQALGRARYIFHDTDFYIVSKDPVKEFEKLFPEVTKDPIIESIFPALIPRESKKDEVIGQITEFLKANETTTISGLMKQYGYARDTIRKWKTEMFDDGLLEMAGAYSFKLTAKGRDPRMVLTPRGNSVCLEEGIRQTFERKFPTRPAEDIREE